jgi:hypothetical protein
VPLLSVVAKSPNCAAIDTPEPEAPEPDPEDPESEDDPDDISVHVLIAVQPKRLAPGVAVLLKKSWPV